MYYGKWGQGKKLNTFEYFIDSLYPEIRAINKADAFIYAFEEPYIDSTNLAKDKSWLRITVDPCFRTPYCIILEKKNNKSYLTTKVTDGQGGYYTGKLVFSLTEIFSDSLYNVVSKELNELDFWTLDKDTTCLGGNDGESWTFEAIENGKYNIIIRSVPLDCGNSVTKKLGQIGTMLRMKSNLVEILSIKTGVSKEEIEKAYRY